MRCSTSANRYIPVWTSRSPSVSECTIADATDGKAGPAEELEQEELRCAIAAAIAALPETERVILLLYYDEEFLMREIGVQVRRERVAYLPNP